MNYSLNIGAWNSVFAVPSSVVDDYIKIANGNSLKLLLFLLRHSSETFTADRLRSELNFSETGELEDAALFWVQRGIISYSSVYDDGSFSASRPNCDASTPEKKETQVVEKAPVTVPQETAKIKPSSVSSGEIASRIKGDSNVKALFEEAEKLYGRPLRQQDNQAVISLVDHYGLPVGVALMLLQYCSRIDKLTPSYILSVADNWQKDEISTIEQADSRIRSLEKQKSIEDSLRNALEMTTKFTDSQKKYIHIWADEWGFSEEMILLALTKTIEQIGNPKYNYTNKILESWKTDGITTVEQANAPASPKAKNANSSFDVDEVTLRLMKRYKG